MTRSKTRTAVAALTAALAIAAVPAPFASAAPVPSAGPGKVLTTQGPAGSTDDFMARKNDGGYKRSAEAKRKAVLCGYLDLIFEQAIQDVKDWRAASDNAKTAEERNQADAEAQSALETAQKAQADSSKYAC